MSLNLEGKKEVVAEVSQRVAKAQAIVDYRKLNGPFKSVDDLKNVKGIGAKRYEKLKADLTVTPLRTAAARPAAGGPAAKGDIKAAEAKPHK